MPSVLKNTYIVKVLWLKVEKHPTIIVKFIFINVSIYFKFLHLMSFSNLQFTFKMTRRSTTILMTMVVPLVSISFLGVFVFMIPAESSGKLGVSLAVLIIEVILLNTVLEIFPVSARNVPALGLFLFLQF